MLTREPDYMPDLSVCVQRHIFRIGWRSPVREHEMASKLGQKNFRRSCNGFGYAALTVLNLPPVNPSLERRFERAHSERMPPGISIGLTNISLTVFQDDSGRTGIAGPGRDVCGRQRHSRQLRRRCGLTGLALPRHASCPDELGYEQVLNGCDLGQGSRPVSSQIERSPKRAQARR